MYVYMAVIVHIYAWDERNSLSEQPEVNSSFICSELQMVSDRDQISADNQEDLL